MLQSKKQIFINAHVETLSDKLAKAEAICVSNGKIEAIGSTEEIQNYVANIPHDIIDCKGKFLYPGFIDTHSHLSVYSNLVHHVYCSKPESKNIADILELLKEKAEKTPKGEWVLAYGYNDSNLEDDRHLNRHDLDSVSTEHPIFVSHMSSHMGYVNSNAIEKLGITKDSYIDDGEYVKDENGEPTGLLFEYAYFESQKSLPSPDAQTMLENFKLGIADYNKQGFTSFFDGGLGFGGELNTCLQTYIRLDKQRELNARAYLQFLQKGIDILDNYALHDFNTSHLKFGGVKHFTDGSIQVGTAALTQDYLGKEGMKGALLATQEQTDALIEKYHCMNVQVAVHANGDAAVESVVLAFERAFKKNPRTDLRHMLIHCQMASDNHLERMKKCGIIPSFFAYHIEAFGDRHVHVFLGRERAERLDPTGSAVRLDMPFGLHVDTPVFPANALGSMHAAVNRLSRSGQLYGADQRITPLKALEAYTKDAALCCNSKVEKENIDRGVIDIGLYADFVLLDKDLLAIDPLEIKNIQVLKTICGGKIVYDAELLKRTL